MSIMEMTKAYQMLYEIEVSLKSNAERRMSIKHGPLWRRKYGEEGKKNLYNVIGLYGKYEELKGFFSTSDRAKLYRLIPIRNKICHMQLLMENEYDLLDVCHQLVEYKIKEGS